MSCLNSSLPCRGRALVLAASALLAALPALSGGARAQFATAISIPAATAPQCVAAGDWDGDLDEDLAIAIASTERVLFLFNDGHEHFLTPIEVQLGTGTSPASIVASDLDGDGDLDVAVSLLGTDSVRVLLNNGGGTFALGSETSTGADPVVLRAGDFNGGAPDLVTCNRAGNSITVLLNTGSASFTASTLGTGPSPRDVNVGDLNGDGDIDIAVAVHDNRRIELYANGGTGAFVTAGAAFLGGSLQPSGVAVARLDGDDEEDLAVAASGGGLHVVATFINAGPGIGAGAFTGPVSMPVAALDPVRVTDGDFNHDGHPDLATLNQGSGNVSVMLGDGAAHFGSPGLFAVGATPESLLAADVDDNGGVDLLTANEAGDDVSLLLNLNGDTAFVAVPDSGLAGVSGIPTLLGDGTLQGGTSVALHLTGAAINSAAGLVIGTSQVNVPFKGGIVVPDDDALLLLPVSNSGTLELTGTFPAGVPSGTDLYLQYIVADAAAPLGFSLSNAIQGTTP